jgi:aspartyl-tRNA synthetase
MFEWNEGEQRLEALHHPFTAPHPDDMQQVSRAAAGLHAACAVS